MKLDTGYCFCFIEHKTKVLHVPKGRRVYIKTVRMSWFISYFVLEPVH